MTFHEHKISNTGWVWNGDERERSGTEQNRKECSTFLNLHFLDQKWSRDLEFALAKLRGLCKYLANVYNLHSHVYGLHYSTCAQEQGRKINAMRRAILKKGSTLSRHRIWRSLLAIWICRISSNPLRRYGEVFTPRPPPLPYGRSIRRVLTATL